MKLRVFGSGSGGNALAVRSGGTLLLLDCGFCCTELERRMSACEVDPDAAEGLFFTHDHADHCQGLAVFHKRHPSVPLYANGNTADAGLREKFRAHKETLRAKVAKANERIHQAE